MRKRRKKYVFFEYKIDFVFPACFKNQFPFKIQLEFDDSRQDECNSLVLPSKKRKTMVKEFNTPAVRLLSKKQRKFYEKILEKKKKKEKVF